MLEFHPEKNTLIKTYEEKGEVIGLYNDGHGGHYRMTIRKIEKPNLSERFMNIDVSFMLQMIIIAMALLMATVTISMFFK